MEIVRMAECMLANCTCDCDLYWCDCGHCEAEQCHEWPEQ